MNQILYMVFIIGNDVFSNAHTELFICFAKVICTVDILKGCSLGYCNSLIPFYDVFYLILQDDEFHSYCKPVLEPKLTKFCKELTHITQVTIVTLW